MTIETEWIALILTPLSLLDKLTGWKKIINRTEELKCTSAVSTVAPSNEWHCTYSLVVRVIDHTCITFQYKG